MKADRRFVALVIAAAQALMATAPAAERGDPGGADTTDRSCQLALDRLATHETAMAAANADERADVERKTALAQRHTALRREASVVCLGNPPPDVERQRFAEPPVAVPPVVTAPPRSPGGVHAPEENARNAPPAPRPAPAPPGPRAPSAITSCDALGCWANDGSRLNRMGPDLVGERGVCKAQGRLLRCP